MAGYQCGAMREVRATQKGRKEGCSILISLMAGTIKRRLRARFDRFKTRHRVLPIGFARGRERRSIQ